MTSHRPPRHALSNATKLSQMAVATPQVMAHRLTRMALAGPLPSTRDQSEFMGMFIEKQVAFTQAWVAATTQVWQLQQQWWMALLKGQHFSLSSALHAVSAKAIAPLHRKAVSNAKRLSRTPLR